MFYLLILKQKKNMQNDFVNKFRDFPQNSKVREITTFLMKYASNILLLKFLLKCVDRTI